MVRYLAELRLPMLVLWCYLIWYLVTVWRYFDPSPRLWLNSLGISAIIGTALYLSVAFNGASRTPLGPWQVFRLFVMPFCVSSFAAIIKGQGFLLVFDPSLARNLWAGSVCLGFVGLTVLARWVESRRALTGTDLAASAGPGR